MSDADDADLAPLKLVGDDGEAGLDATIIAPAPASSPRHSEVEVKQARIGELLAEAGAEALLLLDPANIGWLSGAPLCQGVADPAEWPALYLTPTQRWLVAGSADAQRLFDTYLDGLGFQLKEWPWHGGRERCLADLCALRRSASDKLVSECVPVGPTLRRQRGLLSAPERDRLRALGNIVSHAVEATCRTLAAGQTEAEVAGQLAHRLWHRGAIPTVLHVAADGRAERHRRPGVTDAAIEQTCTVTATASRDGMFATAARTVSLGPKSPELRQEYDAACRTVAARAVAGAPGTTIAELFEVGRRAVAASDYEHAWRDLPFGYLTGWSPVERPFLPASTSVLGDGWAVVWQALVNTAFVADTWLVSEGGPDCVTAVENWPVKRFTASGRSLDLADVLVRE